MKKKDKKLPGEGDILKKQEIDKMVKSEKHPRNKAIIYCLYESGCRSSEFLSLKIKYLDFNKNGVKITIPEGKTGQRKIMLIESSSTLSRWINLHPKKNDRKAPVWCGISDYQGKAISNRTLGKVVKRAAKNIGIKRRIYPHLFRHSRASHLANHLTEAQMNNFFGWVQGSEMPATYIHLNGNDVDNALLKPYGKQEEKKETNKLEKRKPKICSRCKASTDSFQDRCDNCGLPLTPKAAMKAQDQEEVRQNVTNILMDKLIESGAIDPDKFKEVMNSVVKEE